MKPDQPADVGERLNQLQERCAAAGIPVTAQRRVVLEVLCSRRDHPTVEEIHSEVVARLPDVSRATIYRSLETLGELGLLRRVDHPGSAARYDANMDPHHHFLCTGCGQIHDLPLEAVAGHADLRFTGPAPLEAHELSILVRGSCGSCGPVS